MAQVLHAIIVAMRRWPALRSAQHVDDGGGKAGLVVLAEGARSNGVFNGVGGSGNATLIGMAAQLNNACTRSAPKALPARSASSCASVVVRAPAAQRPIRPKPSGPIGSDTAVPSAVQAVINPWPTLISWPSGWL